MDLNIQFFFYKNMRKGERKQNDKKTNRKNKNKQTNKTSECHGVCVCVCVFERPPVCPSENTTRRKGRFHGDDPRKGTGSPLCGNNTRLLRQSGNSYSIMGWPDSPSQIRLGLSLIYL